MNEKITSEVQLKEKLGINNWRELSKEKLLQYMKLAPNIDKELHIKILEQVPNFIQLTNDITTNVINIAEKKKEVSVTVLNVLRTIAESLNELIKKDNITPEERMYAIDKVIELSRIIDDIDKRNGDFFDTVVKIAAGIGGFGLAVLAVVLGIKFSNKND